MPLPLPFLPAARRRRLALVPSQGPASRVWCVLGAVLLSLSADAFGATEKWEQRAPLPIPNGGFVCGESDGGIVVAGGVTWKGETKLWLDGMWRYDPNRDTWSEAGRLPVPLAYAVSAIARDSVWIAGGSSGEATHRTLWRMEAGSPPRPVATLERGFVSATGGLIGDLLYVVGGTDFQGEVARATNAFVAVDVRTGVMTPLPDYPEPALISAAAAVAGGRLYVFAGAHWNAAKKAVENHASAHAYDPSTRRWERLPALPHPGRGFAALALDDRRILVAGGYRNDVVEFVPDAYVYDVHSQTYHPTTPLPYAAMVTLMKSGEWVYCLGGEDRKRHRTDSVFRVRWRTLLPSQ